MSMLQRVGRRGERELSTHGRLVEAAIRLTSEHGWANVTMARLADEVGVSRQTVYNEIGTKSALAEAMVRSELEAFLKIVNDSFDANPTNLVEAIRTTVREALTYAENNQLLHAVVSATHGADTELLPLLTTNSQGLLEAAKMVVIERIKPYPVGIDPDDLEAAMDMVVRVVLSNVMQPSGSPSKTADDIAWVASRVLG